MSRQIGADRPAQSRGVSAAITPGLFAGFAAIVVVLVAARIIGTVNLRNVYTSSEAARTPIRSRTRCSRSSRQRWTRKPADAGS